MKKSGIKLSIILFFLVYMVYGQRRQTGYIFYKDNMNFINPSFAWSGGVEIGMNVRSQWASVKGGLETQSFFFSKSINHRVGLGVSLTNDRTFIESRVFTGVDFSYRVTLSEKMNLLLGIKAGFESYNIDWTEFGNLGVDIISDPLLYGIDGGFTPNIGAGALVRGEGYFLSLSIPMLLSNNYLRTRANRQVYFSDRLEFFFAGGWNYDFTNNLKGKVSSLVNYVTGTPLTINTTMGLEFNNKIELGLNYRVNLSLAGLFIFNVSDSVRIGYSYETPTKNSIYDFGNGSHELYLKLELFKKTRLFDRYRRF